MLNGRALLAVLTRPLLWPEALRALFALSARGWWRRGLPRPEPGYAAWRVATAYGNSEAPIAPDDLVAYLRWRKRQRTARGSRGG